MHICYLAEKVRITVDPDEGSGSTTHTLGVARSLKELGHHVSIISRGHDNDQLQDKIDGLNVFRLKRTTSADSSLASKVGYSPFIQKLKELTKRALAQKQAYPTAKIIKKLNPDLILMRATREGQGRLISRLTGVPLVLEVIDIQYNKRDAQAAKYIIAYTKRLFPSSLHQKVQVVTAGFDPEIFHPLPDVKPHYDLGFIGSFKAWDGVEDIIKAAPLIMAKRPQTTFLLAGDGTMLPQTKKLVEEANLQDSFTFTGRFPLSQAAHMINQCRIGLAPYNHKRWLKGGEINGRYLASAGFEKYGFYFSPLRVFEYLGCGRPIIASSYPSIKSIIGPANGALVEPGDHRALAQKCLELLNSDELEKIAQHNRQEASEHTWLAAVEKFKLQ